MLMTYKAICVDKVNLTVRKITEGTDRREVEAYMHAQKNREYSEQQDDYEFWTIVYVPRGACVSRSPK